MRTPWTIIALAAGLAAQAQGLSRQAAETILDAPGTVPVRVGRLVAHLHQVMPFVATDYRQRTVDQVLERGAGNCADHARVLMSLLESRSIAVRWVHEINLQAPSEPRQASASAKVKEAGYGMSVFGRRHNDHRWLEVWDPETRSWFPADSSIGVTGMKTWVERRLGFSGRAEAVAGMIAPVFVEAIPTPKEHVSRTTAYVLDGFNQRYGGRLAGLTAWPRWVAAVRAFEPLASGAFLGNVNLHSHQAQVDELAQAYEALEQEARHAGLASGPSAAPAPDKIP